MEEIKIILKVLACCYLLFYIFSIYGVIVLRKKEDEITKFLKFTMLERTIGALFALGVLIYID